MTAREMRAQDVPHDYVMASMRAFGLITAPGAREALAVVLPMHRDAVIEEIAARLEAFDRAEAAAIVRSMADATTPTSKDQRDGA